MFSDVLSAAYQEGFDIGTVKIYFKEAGYGFLLDAMHREVFFHHSSLPGTDGHRDVFAGDICIYKSLFDGDKYRTNEIIAVIRTKEDV